MAFAAQAQAQPSRILPLSATGEANEAAVTWGFRIDQGRGAGEWRKIPVPSNWEQQGFGTYLYGVQGGVLDLHEVAYNDAVPGESYTYPEFSGYFSNWQWLTLQTDSGNITLENSSGIPYFGLYRPPGGARPILELPDVGLSLLTVIPAMGSKFGAPELFGPQSQPQTLSGSYKWRVLIRLQ